MSIASKVSAPIRYFATAGLIAKGIVYILLGLLAGMAAFHISGQSTKNTNKEGVLSFIEKQTGGHIILGVIAVGLLCYTIWRGIQAFANSERKGDDAKGYAVRARYLFSGLVYALLAIFAIKKLFAATASSGKSNNQGMVEELLTKPFGQWLLGIAAAVIAAVGIYQITYALSEKYSKHVGNLAYSSNKKLVLAAGKIGYVSRGIVWLIIAWLFTKAALHSNSSEAGDTSSAFKFLANASYGDYLLGAVAGGLICYGVFNLIRARYESFG